MSTPTESSTAPSAAGPLRGITAASPEIAPHRAGWRSAAAQVCAALAAARPPRGIAAALPEIAPHRAAAAAPARGLRRVPAATWGCAALAVAAAVLGASTACARAPQPPPGREVRFEELEMSLRLPEGWRSEDAYALYARQRQIPESEARALPLLEVARQTRALLVARPPEGSGASPLCMLSIEIEDLSSYPGVNDVSAYAELAERAGLKRLSGYERLGEDARLSAGAAPAVRRECRALAPIGANPPAVRNLTLFLKKDSLGIAVAGYELEAQFEPRRADFDSILGSVRMGKEQAPPPWERLLRWLSGRG